MPTLTDPWFADAQSDRWLLPILPPYERVHPDLDGRLGHAAMAAANGDQRARDVLYAAFTARLEPVVLRLACHPLIIRDPAIDADDLRQEGYLVFVDLVGRWNRKGSFTSYLTIYFPHRLSRAARRLSRPDQSSSLTDGEVIDTSARADAARAHLLMLADLLPPARKGLLLARIDGQRSLRSIALERGVSPRHLQREWQATIATLRAHRSTSRSTSPTE